MHTAKAAQTFKIHFIDVGCADAALLQYGEGTEAKYALIDTGANQYHNTKDTTIDTTKTPVYEYLNKMGVKTSGIYTSDTSSSGSYWRYGEDSF